MWRHAFLRCVVVWMVMLCGSAQAHLMPAQQGTLNVVDRSVFTALALPVSALPGFDVNGDGRWSAFELHLQLADIKTQVQRRFQLFDDQQLGVTDFVQLMAESDERQDGAGSSAPDAGGQHVLLLMKTSFTDVPRALRVETDLFGALLTERQLTLKASHGELEDVAVLSPMNHLHQFFRAPWRVLLDYVAVGMAHILSGTDHLLYLLTIVVAAAGWRYWLSVLTSFTVAHSVTLSLGLMGWIKVNALVVEPLIAVSIVLMALLNLVQREAVVSRALIRQRMALVFACGLLHGLGFASSMAEMGLNSAYRLTSLLGFNLGIEVGQAVFVLAVLMLQTAVVWGSRLSIQRLPVAMAVLTRQRVGLLTSALACLVGSFWLAQRLLVWV